MKILIFLLIFISLSGMLYQANAESVKITYSPTMERAIFDGKWTNFLEWKNTSWNEMRFEEGLAHLRTAHFENFVYIFIDAVSDESLDFGKDEAIVCFDTKNNKAEIFDMDDYCFSVLLGEDEGMTFQGISEAKNGEILKKIENPQGLVAISGVSDENDPYRKTPHPGFEFRIPTEFIGRSNQYGFYVSIFDYGKNQSFSWPTTLEHQNYPNLHSPNNWGDLISPDNSLPEFEWPLLAILPAFIGILLITKLRKNLFNQITPDH